MLWVDRTYWTECNGGGGKAYEAAISGMRLVNSVGIVIAELVEDLLNLLLLAGGAQLPDDPFQPMDQNHQSAILSRFCRDR
jgi:hypothetical protein